MRILYHNEKLNKRQILYFAQTPTQAKVLRYGKGFSSYWSGLLFKVLVEWPPNIAFTRTGEIGLFWNYLVNSQVVGLSSPVGEAGVIFYRKSIAGIFPPKNHRLKRESYEQT